MILTHHGINSLGRGEEYPDEAYDFDMADIKRIFPAADENSGITLGAVITPTRNIVVDSYAWFAYQQERNNWNPAVGIYETDMSITEHYAQNLTKVWGSTSNDRISVTNNVFELNGKQWDKILVTLPQAITLEAGKTYTFFTRKNRYARAEGAAEDVYVVPGKTQSAFIYYGWSIPDQNYIMDGPGTMPAVYLEINNQPYNQ